MPPRQLIPGSTYLITRRCTQRQFLLRPDPVVNSIFLFCVVRAAQLYPVRIHAVCVMSNHYHLIVTDDLAGDDDTNLPEFVRWLNEHVAKCMNAYLGRSQNFWDNRPYSAVRLVDDATFVEKTAYLMSNPTAAGLVERGEQWPGIRLCAGMNSDDTQPVEVKRPEVFFREDGDVPVKANLALELPPFLKDLGDEEFRSYLYGRIQLRESEHRKRHVDAGRPFLGRLGVLGQSPYSRPTAPEAPPDLNPQVACLDTSWRKELIEDLRTFLAAYRQALTDYRSGDRDTVFPLGTYWMRRYLGVNCMPAPAPT